MTKRQATFIKFAAIIAALLLVLWLTITIDSALAAPQPTTRRVEWLLAPDGLVYGGRDEGFILPIGQWSGQSLVGDRPIRGRNRVLRVTAAGGEDILFAYFVPPPSRSGSGESFDMAAIEFPGSLWIPLSGRASGWQLDGNVLRISVLIYLRQ